MRRNVIYDLLTHTHTHTRLHTFSKKKNLKRYQNVLKAQPQFRQINKNENFE